MAKLGIVRDIAGRLLRATQQFVDEAHGQWIPIPQ
jgi:hypothetical protein